MKNIRFNTTSINDCHAGCHEVLHNKSRDSFSKKRLSVLSSLAILVLPKCPFCIVAYSSTITLCSAQGVFTGMQHHIGWGAYAVLGISVLITIYMLAKKNKNSSRISGICCALGAGSSLLIYLAIFEWHDMNIYYTATLLLIAATMLHSGLYKKILYILRLKQLQKGME